MGAGTSNRQAKYGVLARPFDWSIAQSGDADAAWQSALDGSPHEIGGKEGERVSGRTIVMALRTDGNPRYSWTKNKRSPFVS